MSCECLRQCHKHYCSDNPPGKIHEYNCFSFRVPSGGAGGRRPADGSGCLEGQGCCCRRSLSWPSRRPPLSCAPGSSMLETMLRRLPRCPLQTSASSGRAAQRLRTPSSQQQTSWVSRYACRTTLLSDPVFASNRDLLPAAAPHQPHQCRHCGLWLLSSRLPVFQKLHRCPLMAAVLRRLPQPGGLYQGRHQGDQQAGV